MVTCWDLEKFHVPDTDVNFKYFVYQVECAPETEEIEGSRAHGWHIQGYLELKRQTDFAVVKTMFLPAVVHLERRRGSRAQAIAYCKKLDTRVAPPLEFGNDEGGHQGARADLETARQKILSCKSWPEVMHCEEISYVVARHLQWAKEVFDTRPMNIPVQEDLVLRKWENRVISILDGEPQNRRIIWIWSALSGTGKTTFFNYCSTKYNVLPGADWTNTIFLYDCHAVVWFDRTRYVMCLWSQ